jgi:hypothetical protein
MALILKRGWDSDRASYTPALGEPIYVKDSKLLYVGDSETSGGNLIYADLDNIPELIDSEFILERIQDVPSIDSDWVIRQYKKLLTDSEYVMYVAEAAKGQISKKQIKALNIPVKPTYQSRIEREYMRTEVFGVSVVDSYDITSNYFNKVKDSIRPEPYIIIDRNLFTTSSPYNFNLNWFTTEFGRKFSLDPGEKQIIKFLWVNASSNTQKRFINRVRSYTFDENDQRVFNDLLDPIFYLDGYRVAPNPAFLRGNVLFETTITIRRINNISSHNRAAYIVTSDFQQYDL